MDFIFMLTRDDRTVAECLRAAEAAISLGIEHVGFKDVGARPAVLRELVQRIKEAGATSYLEIVGLAPDATRRAVDLALELQIDCLLGGGGDLRTLASLVAGSGIAYYPFAGRPQGHPTVLDGTPAEIAADCALADELGCAGVDLLAYRATTTDPLALVRRARAALQGRLVVAGSIASPTQIAALAGAGVDAFTIGSALFAGRFAPDRPGLGDQLAAVVEACAASAGQPSS